MLKKLLHLLILFFCLETLPALSQVVGPVQQQQTSPYSDTSRRKPISDADMMDSLRKKEENGHDTVIYTSKYIRVTNERLLIDSTQVLPLDTGLTNFENYSPLYQPHHPTIGLGNLGLAERSLLFEPQKYVGFDVGLHYLDAYMFGPHDVQYYQAHVPYTNLSLYAAGNKEQYFKVIHSQNINPNLNIGANLNFIGSRGYYNRQNVSDLNAVLFSWYQSKGKRYNLLTNLFFNNLKAPESGGLVNENIFNTGSFDQYQESIKLVNAKSVVRNDGFYLKQFYYIGRIDSAGNAKGQAGVKPTQRLTHSFLYNKQKYVFNQSGADAYHVFPDYYFNSVNSLDSLAMQDIHNDFSYSFYLRPNSVSFVKNELKLDLGLAHDLYQYKQYVNDSVLTVFGKVNQETLKQSATFQNITLKARVGYQFNNQVLLDADLQQVAEGRNFGDYLYDVKFTLAGGRKAGRIVLGAYAQNNAPTLVQSDWISNHYVFHTSFKNQKTVNLNFNYLNEALQLDLKAEYFLINDYIYFKAQTGGVDATPTQLTAPINLIKVSISKNLTWRRIHFDNFLVYQKTDYQSTLRTPEVYVYSNLYSGRRFFDAIDLVGGVSVRYNTQFVAPSYAVSIGQFYNGADVTFKSYPYASIYLKGTLQRTNLFIQYDYANQGLFSNGFYTVNRYPMQDAALKLGVSWNFYN